jgi:putative CocE/NonD family hydrolase
MKKIIGIGLLCLGSFLYSQSQRYFFPHSLKDENSISINMKMLAQQLVLQYREENQEKYLSSLFRFQMLSGDNAGAIQSIEKLRVLSSSNDPNSEVAFIQYYLYAKTKEQETAGRQEFGQLFDRFFNEAIKKLDDKKELYVSTAFISPNGIAAMKQEWERNFEKSKNKDSLELDVAMTLCNDYLLYQVFREIEPISISLLKAEDNRRYIIEDSILISYGQAKIWAVSVRSKAIITPQPTALQFTIYAGNDYYYAKFAAAHGYAGVIAFTRGKGLSPDSIEPYEHEVTDVNVVIEWITRQPWSNKEVGMYGGSYNGFTQWAATKHLHPALKTIVPYVAALPGLGLPMENNVFLNANYGWAFYVTNNKYLDNQIYYGSTRWSEMQQRWYESGVAYKRIDSIDGTPNKWFQRWIGHPDFDQYWQRMIPYRLDYARINIPVLTITGYYDDGQISALHYLSEHYKYNKNANHYLIIGPYDHFGAQRGGTPYLRGYAVDSVALINTQEITFAWFDFIFKGGKKPDLLQDKINFEVMTANRWMHAPSLEKMGNSVINFYLSDAGSADHRSLVEKKPSAIVAMSQLVDLKDRTTINNDYYPNPIIRNNYGLSGGLSFISAPLTQSVIVAGQFSGILKVRINKKDMDVGMTLYEVLPDGRYFSLAYFLGRASYAADMSKRKLLTPGKIETIPVQRSRLVCKRIEKGSRLLLVLNVNKNSFAEINYGTGKNVSDETISDAEESLKIEWFNDSYIRIPVWK